MKDKIVAFVFIALAVIYFTPVSLPYGMCYPLALLSLAAWLGRPWLVAAALTFSLVGDLMGVLHQFPFQLSAFALCHICLIVFFYARMPRGAWKRCRWALALGAIWLTLAAAVLLPVLKEAWLHFAVMFYAVVILLMAFGATCQGNRWLTIGAWLFVLSDSILAYNRFVTHLPNSSLLIMIPYYSAQLLIFLSIPSLLESKKQKI